MLVFSAQQIALPGANWSGQAVLTRIHRCANLDACLRRKVTGESYWQFSVYAALKTCRRVLCIQNTGQCLQLHTSGSYDSSTCMLPISSVHEQIAKTHAHTHTRERLYSDGFLLQAKVIDGSRFGRTHVNACISTGTRPYKQRSWWFKFHAAHKFCTWASCLRTHANACSSAGISPSPYTQLHKLAYRL